MNLLRAATLSVRDPLASARRYAEWLDYEIIESGNVDYALAQIWRAPNCAGKPFVLMAPRSGAPVFLRFVASEIPPAYAPLRTYGWAAIELCVTDVERVYARLQSSPFEVIGPPRLLDTMPEIYPMQVRGPDDEIIYLTEIRDNPIGIRLRRASSFIDSLFIAVLACSDVDASMRWFAETLSLAKGVDAAITYTMLAKAFDLPLDQKHRIITGLHEADCFLELDQYPDIATTRQCIPGELTPGISFTTMLAPNFSAIEPLMISAPIRADSALYDGRRAGVLVAPDGTCVEVVEA